MTSFVQHINQRFLSLVKVDARKNNWIVGFDDTSGVYGKLLSKNKHITSSSKLKIEHYLSKSDDDGKLCLQKCVNKNCNLGSYHNNSCVLEVTKSKSLHILGKQKRSSVNGLIQNITLKMKL